MAASTWREFANISLSGKVYLEQVAKIFRKDQVIEITSETATLRSEDHGNGRIIVLNKADGIDLTLPQASGSGDRFDLFMAVTATSNHTIVTYGSDDMTGVSVTGQGGTANVWPTGDNAEKFTMNGSTKGGFEGDRIILIDVAAGLWQINHFGEATGTEETPFGLKIA